MSNGIPEKPKGKPNFTLAFKQMASFVAIAKTRATSQVLDELIQQCYLLLPSDPLATSDEIVNALYSLFGILLNKKEVAIAIQRLIRTGALLDAGNGQLALAQAKQASLSSRVEIAKKLECDVRDKWLEQARVLAPQLDGEKLWITLRAYLAQSFRRHGMQAIELLDPSVDTAKENKINLSTVLDGVIAKEFNGEDRRFARDAISNFFITVSTDRKRAEYIASLADGAFNYFSLAVAPEVSEKLRGKLNNLTLFLDTNFLFGILNLHVNPQVDVSSELLEAIRRFKLPFRLRYHDATVREMTNTLFYFEKELNRQKWPQKISRAVVASGSLSGVEMRYHSKNAEQPISVDDFVAPYRHWQILLKDKGIDVYHVDSSESRMRARADLEADYVKYLTSVNREKPIDAVQHDMTVLETVRSLRTNAKNTLDAGSILVTCDYHLFRFDFEESRNNNKHHSTVLPSLLWQMLRPFVADSDEFDKAFAETFALPEFSLTRGGAQRAAARMASILASYSEIPEETAAKMLANDLLISELQTKRSDAEFEETVESAIAACNAGLVEEKAALAAQLEREKAERLTKERELKAAADLLNTREQSLAEQQRVLSEKEQVIKQLEARAGETSNEAREAALQVLKEHEERKEAERMVAELTNAADIAKERALKTAKFASVVVGLLIVSLLELGLHFVWPCRWLIEHPNGYGLQACFGFMIFFGIVGAWVQPWRKFCWAGACLGLLLVAFQILGGKAPVH